MNLCQVWLTYADKKEAGEIAKVLLEKKLVGCAKQMPISSSFRWKGNIENSDEALLIMDSREDLFDEIDTEVAKIHSYETFLLQSVAIRKISKKAELRLDSVLK